MGDPRARRGDHGCDAADDAPPTDEEERLRARTAVALYLFAGVAIGGALAVDGCLAALALDGRTRRDVLGGFLDARA
jgi:hypothetical protein